MADTIHKQGCPALGGYGHGVEACICGADTPTPAELARTLQEYSDKCSEAIERGGIIALDLALVNALDRGAAALSRLSQVERERDASDAVIFEDDAKKHADFPDNLPGGDTHDRAAAIERHKRSRQKAGQT